MRKPIADRDSIVYSKQITSFQKRKIEFKIGSTHINQTPRTTLHQSLSQTDYIAAKKIFLQHLQSLALIKLFITKGINAFNRVCNLAPHTILRTIQLLNASHIHFLKHQQANISSRPIDICVKPHLLIKPTIEVPFCSLAPSKRSSLTRN